MANNIGDFFREIEDAWNIIVSREKNLSEEKRMFLDDRNGDYSIVIDPSWIVSSDFPVDCLSKLIMRKLKCDKDDQISEIRVRRNGNFGKNNFYVNIYTKKGKSIIFGKQRGQTYHGDEICSINYLLQGIKNIRNGNNKYGKIDLHSTSPIDTTLADDRIIESEFVEIVKKFLEYYYYCDNERNYGKSMVILDNTNTEPNAHGERIPRPGPRPTSHKDETFTLNKDQKEEIFERKIIPYTKRIVKKGINPTHVVYIYKIKGEVRGKGYLFVAEPIVQGETRVSFVHTENFESGINEDNLINQRIEQLVQANNNIPNSITLRHRGTCEKFEGRIHYLISGINNPSVETYLRKLFKELYGVYEDRENTYSSDETYRMNSARVLARKGEK